MVEYIDLLKNVLLKKPREHAIHLIVLCAII